MARSLLAACLAFAGIYVLAGVGWALLAGSFLTFALWPSGTDTALAQAGRKAVTLARSAGSAAIAAPRRAAAMVGASGGLALVPLGLALSAGLGVALVAAGGLLTGGALLLGWNA